MSQSDKELAGGADPQILKARATVHRLFKFRPRSEHEIREKLRTKGMDQRVIDLTVEHFTRLGMVQDEQFARAWTNSRLGRSVGINRIRYELKSKGIADDIIKATLAGIGEDYSEENAALEAARKRVDKYRRLEPAKAKKRLYDFLLRRGFRTSAAQKALRQLMKGRYDNE